MLLKTKGIVLKTIKYGETSLIVDIFTLEKGRLSYIISGVRKKNSRVSASLLQVMSILDLVVYHTDREKLHRIKEVKPAFFFTSIPFDIRKSSMLLFLAEVCSKTIQQPEANEALFTFIENALISLDQSASNFGNHHLLFLVGLAEQLGFQIQNRIKEEDHYFDMETGQFLSRMPDHMHVIQPPESDYLARLLRIFDREENVPIVRRNDRKMLLPLLLLYYKYHIDNLREIKSYQILSEVL